MFIDDHDLDIFFNMRMLQLAGTDFVGDIISFVSCRQALDYFWKNQDEPEKIPTLVLLDIQLPEMNGFEFLEHYADLPDKVKGQCKVFILSSTEDESELKMARTNPYVIEVLKKPLDTDLLKKFMIAEEQRKY